MKGSIHNSLGESADPADGCFVKTASTVQREMETLLRCPEDLFILHSLQYDGLYLINYSAIA